MSATIYQGVVHEDGSFSIAARIAKSDPEQTPLVQADIDTMTYSIFDEATNLAVVEGQSLTVASVVFNTLQNWPGRALGYNFLATFPPASIPNGRRTYRLEIKTTLTDGQVAWDKWSLKSLETRSS